MKELSIEEKAKRYDDLLVKLQEAKVDNNVCDERYCCVIDDIVPELKESEDEKIRKYIIKYFEASKDELFEGFKWNGITVEECIAWLEKQGEPTEINPSEFDSQLNRLLKQFESLPKDDIASSLSFYLNVVQNNGTYKEEKQGEQKPAEWSEEDEMILSDIIKDLVHPWNEYIPYRIEDEIKWLKNKLKTLKDRVQSQPKQEWSKEDEAAKNDIIAKLAILKSRAIDGGAEKEICEMEIDWLKSLRPQKQWKPSDEQMDALNDVISSRDIKYDVLSELWKDLEKLRKE